MSELKTVPGVLDIIRNITSNRESGRLEIHSSGTYGTLLFNEGQLVDARLGSLSGFQAVNAAVSLVDAQFSFDHVVPASHSSTITPSERVVLKRFFGIIAAEIEEPADDADVNPDWNTAPEQVVPLAEVEEVPQTELDETPTVEVEALHVERPTKSLPLASARGLAFLSKPRIAVSLALLVFLAIGAIALRSKMKARQQTASVAAVESVETAAVNAQSSSIPDSQPAVNVAVRDLTGDWRVINTVEKTAYKSFNNLQVGFSLKISQRGNEFTAKGEKFSENGQTLPSSSRTPIHVTGIVDGDKVVATFVEDGRMRRTNGRFIWRLQTDRGRLAGTFVSNAANSSGRSAVTKQ